MKHSSSQKILALFYPAFLTISHAQSGFSFQEKYVGGNYMKIITILLVLLLICCTSQPNLDQYLEKMEISLSDDCNIISSEYSSAIGDMSASFTFKVSDHDFENIIEVITHVDGYNDNKVSHNITGKYAYKEDDKYIYEVVKENNKSIERYCLHIYNDKTITLSYIQE